MVKVGRIITNKFAYKQEVKGKKGNYRPEVTRGFQEVKVPR
jgi:hypothetical protein